MDYVMQVPSHRNIATQDTSALLVYSTVFLTAHVVVIGTVGCTVSSTVVQHARWS